MRKEIVRITTADTKETHEFPGKDLPDLWAVGIMINSLDGRGHHTAGRSIIHTVYVERQTLVNAGLRPVCAEDKKPTPEDEETAEDLILRLLEMVDVYPTE